MCPRNPRNPPEIPSYSLRARESPFVSFPLVWPEVERAAAGRSPAKLAVLHSEALRRVKEHGDRFRDVLTKQQPLPRF